MAVHRGEFNTRLGFILAAAGTRGGASDLFLRPDRLPVGAGRASSSWQIQRSAKVGDVRYRARD